MSRWVLGRVAPAAGGLGRVVGRVGAAAPGSRPWLVTLTRGRLLDSGCEAAGICMLPRSSQLGSARLTRLVRAGLHRGSDRVRGRVPGSNAPAGARRVAGATTDALLGSAAGDAARGAACSSSSAFGGARRRPTVAERATSRDDVDRRPLSWCGDGQPGAARSVEGRQRRLLSGVGRRQRGWRWGWRWGWRRGWWPG